MIVDITAHSARISGKSVWTFVRARDDAGRTGWGEATLQGEAAAIHAHVARLAPAIVERTLPLPLEVAGMVGTHGGSAAEAAAISAVDQALWDIAAQARGCSLAHALGSPRRSTIELYANINRGTVERSPAGFAARARAAASGGFAAIKIAPFDDVRPESIVTREGRRLVQAGIERVAAVRDALGPERALLVDCHWRLTEAAASQVLRELEPLRLYWFECPLPEEPANFAALRRLRSQANAAGVRLAGCESLTGVAAFESFLAAGVYDAIMPDVKYAGGMLEVLRVGDAAARHGTICSPHNPSGPIAHAHSVHVSALLADCPFLEFQLGESPLFFDLLDPLVGVLPDPETGSSALPAGNGLGVGIDMLSVPPSSDPQPPTARRSSS